MSILYLGLGMAMISGISAMMQIGNNINNLMLLSTFKKNNYFESSLPSYDRKIIKIIYDYAGPDTNVCSFVKENISDTPYEHGEIFISTGTQTPSTNSLFINSCVLINKNLSHRVLITKNNIGTFNLFSCYMKDETFCPYEVNK